MKITYQVLAIHHFTTAEWTTLCEAENIIRKIHEAYDDNIMLRNPNTGECVTIDELPRVMGILSFFTENRAVEVNPK